MSNHVVIQPTEFKNIPQGTSTLGVRIYDNYGVSYDNTWKSIPDDDLEIFKMCIDLECGLPFFEYILEHNASVSIGDVLYDWEQIKHFFE